MMSGESGDGEAGREVRRGESGYVEARKMGEEAGSGSVPRVHSIGHIPAWRARQKGVETGGGPDIFVVKSAGVVVAWEGHLAYRGGNQGGGHRGKIGGWSAKSRNRMRKQFLAVDWEACGPLMLVGLTYPAAGCESGERAKRDLETFVDRFERRWKMKLVCAWKAEIQVREVQGPGEAIHFLLLAKRPPGVSHREFRAWLSLAWFEICGTGDPLHLGAGTSVKWWEDRPGCYGPGAYFVNYGAKGSKEYQNRCPEGWLPGRRWGLRGIKARWEAREVTCGELVAVRRLGRRLRAHRGKGPGRKFFSEPCGGWVAGGNRRGELAGRLGLAGLGRPLEGVETKGKGEGG